MHVRVPRAKRGRCRHAGTDQTIATAVVLAVTTVLLLIGFSGPSVGFYLPGRTGWLYIAGVIILAAAFLARLFFFI